MHTSKANSDHAQDMFHLCEDDIDLSRVAYNAGSSLLNYYETNAYKQAHIHMTLTKSQAVYCLYTNTTHALRGILPFGR